jgi:hypothetical protein
MDTGRKNGGVGGDIDPSALADRFSHGQAVTACHLDDRAAGTARLAAGLLSRHFWTSADFTLSLQPAAW